MSLVKNRGQPVQPASCLKQNGMPRDLLAIKMLDLHLHLPDPWLWCSLQAIERNVAAFMRLSWLCSCSQQTDLRLQVYNSSLQAPKPVIALFPDLQYHQEEDGVGCQTSHQLHPC